MDKSYIECLWRKFYAQLVIECILENNIIDGEHYLKKMGSIINHLKDVQ